MERSTVSCSNIGRFLALIAKRRLLIIKTTLKDATTFSIMALGIMAFSTTIKKHDTQHNDIQHNDT